MDNRNGNTDSGSNQRVDAVKERVKGLVDQGQEKVHALRDRAKDVKQQAVERSNIYVDRATELIKANPLKAVGIAFGVGYIGMRLFRRR